MMKRRSFLAVFAVGLFALSRLARALNYAPLYLSAGGGGSIPITKNSSMTTGNGTHGNAQTATAVQSISSTGITIAAGSNRFLLVPIQWSVGVTGRSVTALKGSIATAMTEELFFTGDGGAPVAFYSLVNPDTGVQTIAASWTTAADCYMGAICLNNAASVKSADNQTSGTGSTVTIPSSTNDATLASIVDNNGDPTSSQTLFEQESALNPGGGADYALGGTSNVHTFSNAGTTRGTIGIHVLAA